MDNDYKYHVEKVGEGRYKVTREPVDNSGVIVFLILLFVPVILCNLLVKAVSPHIPSFLRYYNTYKWFSIPLAFVMLLLLKNSKQQSDKERKISWLFLVWGVIAVAVLSVFLQVMSSLSSSGAISTDNSVTILIHAGWLIHLFYNIILRKIITSFNRSNSITSYRVFNRMEGFVTVFFLILLIIPTVSFPLMNFSEDTALCSGLGRFVMSIVFLVMNGVLAFVTRLPYTK